MRSTLIALLSLMTTPVFAQPAEIASVDRRPPPVLFIQPNPQQPQQKITAKTVDVQVKVVGRLAETRMTLTFGNPNARAMAGDLYVPLPERATVSGYALDVAGQMVDGVVVKAAEARRIFEKEVRKGVDPGLVEWTKGNVFKTRVFPIPANGSRTIMVRWVAPIDDDGSLSLPLQFPDPADVHVRVEIAKGKDKPIVSGEGPLTLKFDERFVAESSVKGKAVVQNLKVKIPDVERRPVQLETIEGQTWFAISETVPVPALASQTPKVIRIVWDASLSREKADRTRELALIEKILVDRYPQAEVDVVILRNEAGPAKAFPAGSGKAVVQYLKDTPNDGGTQLARLAIKGSRKVDLQLVFSDGLSTFGDEEPGRLDAPTFAISSSLETAHDGLAFIARQNGGAYFNLARQKDEAVLGALGKPVFSVLAVKVTAGDAKDLLPGGTEPIVGASFISGRLVSDKATIQISYGVPGQAASMTKSFEVDKAQATTGDLVARAWAERKLSDLMANPEKNADDIVALGKARGIVTPGTSLLVLETLNQYVEYRVRPPASLADMRKQWDEQIERETVERKTTEQERLGQVATMWKEEVDWYERAFTYPPNFRYRDAEPKKGEERTLEGRAFGAASADSVPNDAPRPAPEPVEAEMREEAAEKSKKADDSGKDGNTPEPEPGVALTPWDPQTPYTKAIKAASPAERMAVYLKQRAEFGTAPSFYLDVADIFLAQKDEAMALQVLSNVAELKLEDPALLRVLAHRLGQLDKLGMAAKIFEQVLRLRPEEPQSYRDLGLILARKAATESGAEAKADYQRGLDVLAQVVKQRWDRFEAIELIVLTEMNQIWPLAKAAGVASFPLDDRFQKNMELDVRIAMTWDADMTDMDLHVLEPSKEEAYYGHNLTTIGGKVSRDFTQGYGPEVYAVKKAMKGSYQVKTKFFGSSAAQLQGAVTLQVDVFTNWGRPNQKRKSMTLRLTERKEDFLVGEIEF